MQNFEENYEEIPQKKIFHIISLGLFHRKKNFYKNLTENLVEIQKEFP